MFPSLPSYSSLFLLCLLLFFLLLNHSSPAAAGLLGQICGKTGKYTTNSTYASNLNLLLTSLDSNTSLFGGFSKATIGQIPNRIYGLALCRGDTGASVCRSCLDTAIQDAPNLCPYAKGTIICRFDKLLDVLMGRIADWAAYNSTKMFATGEMTNSTNPPFPTIHGLAQCTWDLSRSQCRRCLSGVLDPRPSMFEGKRGARVLGGSCNYRYEIYPFYAGAPTLRLQSPLETAPPPAPMAPPLVTPAGKEGKKTNVTGMVDAIAITLVAAFLLISTICSCFWRRKPVVKLPLDGTSLEEIASAKSLLLNISTPQVAAANFPEDNKLGEGGFGV